MEYLVIFVLNWVLGSVCLYLAIKVIEPHNTKNKFTTAMVFTFLLTPLAFIPFIGLIFFLVAFVMLCTRYYGLSCLQTLMVFIGEFVIMVLVLVGVGMALGTAGMALERFGVESEEDEAASDAGPQDEVVSDDDDRGRGGSTRPKDEQEKTEQELCNLAGRTSAEVRLDAVQQWVDLEYDRLDGARHRMLEALSGRFDSPIRELLESSITERPPKVDEALLCLKVDELPAHLRDLLLRQVGKASRRHSDAVSKALKPYPDTPDLLVSETLARHGAEKTPGVVTQLIERRGVEWATSDDGKAVLGPVVRTEFSRVDPLLKHTDPVLRALGCDLLAPVSKGSKRALKRMVFLLRDPKVEVRLAAVRCIDQHENPWSCWALARALLPHEKNAGLRKKVAKALEGLPRDKTVDHLRELAGRSKVRDRRAAARAAASIDDPRTVQILLKGLEDKDKRVRRDGIRGLQTLLARSPRLKKLMARRIVIIAKLAKSSDAETKRVARQVHYSITGKLP